MDKYEKEEFLADADIEFYKVKKLLEKNPKVLRDDPILSIDYHKIITLIRQKKLFEKTSDHFDPANAHTALWQDVNDIERNKRLALAGRLANYERMRRMDGEGAGNRGQAENLNLNEEDQSSTIK